MQTIKTLSRGGGKTAEYMAHLFTDLTSQGWPEKTLTNFRPTLLQIAREARGPLMARYDSECRNPCGVVTLANESKELRFHFHKNSMRVGRIDKTKTTDRGPSMIVMPASVKQIRRELKWLYEG